MSFYCETVRDYRVNGKLSDDSTISHFKCDAGQCMSKRLAEHDESVLPFGWNAHMSPKEPGAVYHSCSKKDCYIEVAAWVNPQVKSDSGRSTD